MNNLVERATEIKEEVQGNLKGNFTPDWNYVWDLIGDDNQNRYDRTLFAFVAGAESSIIVGAEICNEIEEKVTPLLLRATVKILELQDRINELESEKN